MHPSRSRKAKKIPAHHSRCLKLVRGRNHASRQLEISTFSQAHVKELKLRNEGQKRKNNMGASFQGLQNSKSPKACALFVEQEEKWPIKGRRVFKRRIKGYKRRSNTSFHTSSFPFLLERIILEAYKQGLNLTSYLVCH